MFPYQYVFIYFRYVEIFRNRIIEFCIISLGSNADFKNHKTKYGYSQNLFAVMKAIKSYTSALYFATIADWKALYGNNMYILCIKL